MTDKVRDQGGAVDERDLVGVASAPAAASASDKDFLYLRLRVDANPVQGNGLKPFAWGFAFSTDSDSTTYEVLATVDGDTRMIGLYRNSETTMANRPEDPADLPALTSYSFATHGRTRDADSTLGSGRDYFIEFALPWSELANVGITRDKSLVVWAASSTQPDRLNGDFACHDAQGGNGLPALSDAKSDGRRADSGGGGTGAGGTSGGGNGNGNDGVSVEGGPGCSASPSRRGNSWFALGLGLAIGALVHRRRRSGPARF